MGGDGGRRVVEAYHHQLQMPEVVLQHHHQSKGKGGTVEVKFTIIVNEQCGQPSSVITITLQFQ